MEGVFICQWSSHMTHLDCIIKCCIIQFMENILWYVSINILNMYYFLISCYIFLIIIFIFSCHMKEYDSDFHYHVNAELYLRQLIECQGFKIKYFHFIENVIYKSDYILRKYFYLFTLHIMIINNKVLFRK